MILKSEVVHESYSRKERAAHVRYEGRGFWGPGNRIHSVGYVMPVYVRKKARQMVLEELASTGGKISNT